MRDFFCFHDDNENEAVEAHIPRHRDSKTKKPRHRDSKIKKHDIKIPKPKNHDIEIRGLKHLNIEKWRQISHNIVIPRLFLQGKKPWHRDSKTKKPRHWDSKSKKPRHGVPVEFWPLCPLIIKLPVRIWHKNRYGFSVIRSSIFFEFPRFLYLIRPDNIL